MKYNDKSIEQQVINKTIELLQKRGIRGWNMDQLSKETALAKNTLYRIIGSKEQLMERIATGHCQCIYSKLLKIIENNQTSLSTLEKVLYTYSELTPSYFSEIFLEYPRIEHSISNNISDMKSKMLTYIREGMSKGIIKSDLDPEQVFELCRSIGRFYSDYAKEERSKKIKFAFKCVLYGIVKP